MSSALHPAMGRPTLRPGAARLVDGRRALETGVDVEAGDHPVAVLALEGDGEAERADPVVLGADHSRRGIALLVDAQQRELQALLLLRDLGHPPADEGLTALLRLRL